MAKAKRDETEPEKIARWQREVARYEGQHADRIVPGTARHNGDGRGGGPTGGILWEDRARMAAARRAAGVTLDRYDREALERYPEPTGWAGETLRP